MFALSVNHEDILSSKRDSDSTVVNCTFLGALDACSGSWLSEWVVRSVSGDYKDLLGVRVGTLTSRLIVIVQW